MGEAERRLEEAYQHYKPYLNDRKECPTLHEMCKMCENWNGKKHDYTECRNLPCFINFLGYVRWQWEMAFDNVD